MNLLKNKRGDEEGIMWPRLLAVIILVAIIIVFIVYFSRIKDYIINFAGRLFGWL